MALTIYIDGGSRGNPGPAAAGVVIHDEAGRVLHEGAYFLGTETNNAAEYRALLLALERATRLPPQPLAIFSDSELLVRQMTGEYRVKNPRLSELHLEAQRLLLRVQRWSFRHIPRDENRRADYLANLALDRSATRILHDVDGAEARQADPPPDAPSAEGAPPAASPPMPPAPSAGTVRQPAAPLDAKPGRSVPVRGSGKADGAPAIRVTVHHPPRAGVCRAPCGEISFQVGNVLPAGLCLHAAHALLPTILSAQNIDPADVAQLPVMIVHCSRPHCGAVFHVGPATAGNGQAPPPGKAPPEAF
jgi:ribonuclease HI